MPDSNPPRPPSSRPVVTDLRKVTDRGCDASQMLCDRCGAEMYRMHAVWRCPACGFKTDCCGW